jgi:hypothetical protein
MNTVTLLVLALFSSPASAATADWYKCVGKTTSNEWNFGRVFYGCNASEFGSDSVVKESYGPLIFSEAKGRDAERKRYMEELHAVIRDASAYYIKKRKPAVTAAEVEAFQLGILTTAAQESYWTHYRLFTDGKYKMMRGDVGHGHGLLQVDDRFHFPAISQGLGWNLLGHMAYAMDIFYAHWERAPSMSCVGSPTNWEARIRSAWAAYNGGSGKICRWTNPNDKWARNDEGFYSNLKNQRWRPLAGNLAKPAAINVPCLIEKRENCPAPGMPQEPTLRENVLYRTVAGAPCVFRGGRLSCLAEFRDHVCLRAVSAFASVEALVLSDAVVRSFPRENLDRHATCSSFAPGLLRVGSMAEARVNINLRATPGGGLVGIFPAGEVAEVLDFELRDSSAKDRYYKIRVGEAVGFVFAGGAADFGNWVVASNLAGPIPTVIARVGEKVQIMNSVGINLRRTAGGVLLGNIPRGTAVTVEEFVVAGAENKVYYRVTHRGVIGYIYTGFLAQPESVAAWTKRL